MMTTIDPRGRSLRRSLIPGAVSLVIHGAIFAAIAGLAAERLVRVDTPARLLDIDSAALDPSPPAAGRPTSAAHAASPDADVSVPTPTPTPADAAESASVEAAIASASEVIAERARALPPPSPRPVAPPPVVRAAPTAPAAAFAGLEARAATRIVYAVDASGAMVHTLSFILDELVRSIERLQPTQAFQVVLFADRPGDGPVRSPPIEPDRDGLIRATRDAKVRTREWLASLVAGGRSNPVDGLEAALRLDPDLVFLLARGIQRTGAGAGEDDPQAALARLEDLNPVDPRTGLRPAVIKALQFVEEDPTGLMPRIAQVHGDGAGSYRLITPEDLGAPPPVAIDDAVPVLDRDSGSALAAAASALADVERSLATVAVLSGVSTVEEAAEVRAAAGRALEALADLPPATTRTADGRPQLLRARAATILAALEPDDDAGNARRVDLALRAIADAQPLPIIDPATDADRDLVVAEARRLSGRPGEAREEIAAIIENRDDAGLDAHGLYSARLALLTSATAAGPASIEAERARAAVRSALEADRRDATAWADPAWRALAAAALARSLREADRPTDEVIAPLLAELGDRNVAEPHRRALVSPRLASVASGLPGLPAEALSAIADHAAWTGRAADAGVGYLLAAERSSDPVLRASALRDAAAQLHAIDDPRAQDAFFQLAAEFPDHPQAHDALTIALGADPSGVAPDRLDTAIRAAPDHPLAGRWRVALARTVRGLAGLDLLEPVDPPTSDAASLAIEIVDELLATSPGDPSLLARAAAVAERAGGVLPSARRLDLAESLLASDPVRALATVSAVPSGDPDADRADLIRLRGLIATDQPAPAFEIARDLATRRESLADRPDETIYWEAATVWLELGSARGGDEARAAAAAHIARLRLLSPALGGPPWSARLERLGR